MKASKTPFQLLSMATTEDDAREAARRARRQRLLQSYYASPEDGEEGSGSTGVHGEKRKSGDTGSRGTMKLESSEFDVDAVTSALLQRASLGDLLRQANKLNREIGALDSGLQRMVYENYAKFISATDTVKKMSENVGSMENGMSALQEKMEGIVKSAESVSEALAPKRESIEQLSGVTALLDRLQFLFELPNRLKAAVSIGAYDQAVAHWTRSAPLLLRYSSIASFSGIHQDAVELMDSVAVSLRQRLEKDDDLDAASETLGLLKALKVDDLDALAKSFLDSQLLVLGTNWRDVLAELGDRDLPGLASEVGSVLLEPLDQLSRLDGVSVETVKEAARPLLQEYSDAMKAAAARTRPGEAVWEGTSLVEQDVGNLSSSPLAGILRSDELGRSLLAAVVEGALSGATNAEEVESALESLKPLYDPDEGSRSLLVVEEVVMAVEGLVLGLIHAREAVGGVGSDQRTDAVSAAKRAQSWAEEGVAAVAAVVPRVFPAKYGLQMSIDVNSIASEASAAAKAHISGHIAEQASRAMDRWRGYFASGVWVGGKPPSGVRPGAKNLVKVLSEVRDRAAAEFGLGTAGGAGGQGGAVLTGIEAQVNRLFADKIAAFSEVEEVNGSSIVEAIVKRTLRALLDEVRRSRFDGAGLDQLLVDVEYLRVGLAALVSGREILPTMLGDVISSARDRCLEEDGSGALSSEQIDAFVDQAIAVEDEASERL